MPSSHGLRVNGTVLPTTETTFMEALRQDGYQTAAAGKLHFHPQWDYAPGDKAGVLKAATGEGAVDPQPSESELPYYGLEHCALAEDHNGGPYGEMLRSHGFDPWEDPHSFTYPQHITTRSKYPPHLSKTTWITDKSLEFLEQRERERPFFLWTSFVHPHHPFVAPEPFDTMYEPAAMPLPVWRDGLERTFPERYLKKHLADGASHEAIAMNNISDDEWRRIKAYYYGMISHIDDQLGRLLDHLEEQGIMDHTLIVFSSDHGELMGDYHLLFKATHYGCVTKTPALWKLPKDVNAGSVINDLCSTIDLSPTLLDIAGVSTPAGTQGHSLMPVLMNQPYESRDELLIEDQTPLRTLLTPDWRLTWHGHGQRGELFNRADDPEELHNLWENGDHQDIRQELTTRLLDALISNIDPLPGQTSLC